MHRREGAGSRPAHGDLHTPPTASRSSAPPAPAGPIHHPRGAPPSTGRPASPPTSNRCPTTDHTPIGSPNPRACRRNAGTAITTNSQGSAAAALGGKVYVIVGISPTPGGGFATTDRVEVYDTRTGRWSDVAPLLAAMNHPNPRLLAAGSTYGGLSGGDSWQALRDAYVFDPRANRWPPAPTFASPPTASVWRPRRPPARRRRGQPDPRGCAP
ncbi:hypothetical protein [Streptomyces sp. NPDC004296]|uniref:hypothetical protein n=1 Tax=Streptomyces sp. NPDC004296 TaxID=3364697 RepID=UPI0036AFB763